MNKLEIAKKSISFVVGMGTTSIVTSIIKNNTDPQKVTEKVSIVTAGVVLGSMASDATKKYTDAKIDEMRDWYNENVKK